MASPSSNLKFVTVTVLVPAMETAKTRGVVCPVDGTVVYCASRLDVAVSPDVNIADPENPVNVDVTNTLTFKANGTAMTGGTVAHLSAGSAAGEIKACVPSALNTVKRGQRLEVATDGAGEGGQSHCVFLIEQV